MTVYTISKTLERNAIKQKMIDEKNAEIEPSQNINISHIHSRTEDMLIEKEMILQKMEQTNLKISITKERKMQCIKTWQNPSY